MDTFGASGLTLLFIACCETIAVAWVYGNSNSDQYFQSWFLKPHFLTSWQHMMAEIWLDKSLESKKSL